MKTIEMQIFKFEELNENIQNKLIQKQIEINSDNYEIERYHIKDIISDYGFNDIKLEYNIGGNSDYFNFDFSYIEENIMQKFFYEILGKESYLFYDIFMNNINSIETEEVCKRYSYSKKKIVISDNFNSIYKNTDFSNLHKFTEKLEEKLTDYYDEICGKIYSHILEDMEYNYSEEYAREILIENDYDYFADGRIYNNF